MQKVGSPLDLAIVVDQDAEPADWDQAILVFLEKVIERRLTAKAKAELSVEVVVSLPPLLHIAPVGNTK